MDSFRRPKFVVCNCGLEVLLLLALEPLADLAEGLREQLLRLLLRLLLLLIPQPCNGSGFGTSNCTAGGGAGRSLSSRITLHRHDGH